MEVLNLRGSDSGHLALRNVGPTDSGAFYIPETGEMSLSNTGFLDFEMRRFYALDLILIDQTKTLEGRTPGVR